MLNIFPNKQTNSSQIIIKSNKNFYDLYGKYIYISL
jgi:hypothetical protein